jgi:predicted DNA-binding transcriptional regulator YafY
MSWKFTRRRLRNELDGKGLRMEKEVRVSQVDAYKTKSGNTRFVLRDEDGNEYTTFKENIARQAVAAEGKRARIEFHEQERNGFRNVYLDRVEPLEEANGDSDHRETDEAAWEVAVEAAPWLVGTSEPKKPVPAKELFARLKPFQEEVAEDIRRDGEE